MLVDAHTHVVAADREAFPLSVAAWAGDWYTRAPCSAEGLMAEMDTAGVDLAVLVQPVGAYSFDNRYAATSAAQHADRFSAACCVDPYGRSPAEELGRWLDHSGVGGVRFFALSAERSWLSDPNTFGLWEQAAASGAHVIVTVFESQFDELAGVLGRFRDVAVSLDHCGFCDIARPEPLVELARFENLHLKVTTNVVDAAAAAEGTARPLVKRLAGAFGAERLMWGSDFCQTHDRPYLELVRDGIEAFSGLRGAQQDACLGGTALRLWPFTQQVDLVEEGLAGDVAGQVAGEDPVG